MGTGAFPVGVESIACLAYLSVSIIYEKLAEIYEFIYIAASTHFSFIAKLVRNNSSVYM
jgi:hypothetical protein